MNNKISFIQLDLLSEYISLEFLVLNNNNLTDGAVEGAFEGMQTLTRLYMDENYLSSIPADLPPTLQELRLNNNNITHMSKLAFAQCVGLKSISLNNNSITDESVVEGPFKDLKHLQIMHINYNFLETVPSNITMSLKELHLKGNRITSIPDDVFDTTAELQVLNLSHNKIINEKIRKKAFYYMIKLEHINLGYNNLSSVPKRLPQSLKTMLFEGNSIMYIKKGSIRHLINLEQVNFSNNKITAVAASAFKGLSSLRHLDISNNQLTEVPRQLPLTLQTAFLYNNHIDSVPRDSFCRKQRTESHLILVRLEGNKISNSNIDVTSLRCLRGYQVAYFY
ncbi:lumican-like [Protopterus annectens]|uniref:lumican-like n=1 Tax=Protopterus annectens TaxID=7888 RepID=UPI001CF97024|nr:lumican-like [Protopterus annectens]